MKAILVLVSLLVLSGCGQFTKTVYVDRPVYITKYRTIEGHYLTNCPIITPPETSRYKSSSCEGRNLLWVETYSKHLERTSIRNKKMEELREVNKYLSEENDKEN